MGTPSVNRHPTQEGRRRRTDTITGLPGRVSWKPGLVQPPPCICNVFSLWSELDLFSFPNREGRRQRREGGREGGQTEGTLASLLPSQSKEGPGVVLSQQEPPGASWMDKVSPTRRQVLTQLLSKQGSTGSPSVPSGGRDIPSSSGFPQLSNRHNTAADRTLKGFCPLLVGAEGATTEKPAEPPMATCADTSVQSSGGRSCSKMRSRAMSQVQDPLSAEMCFLGVSSPDAPVKYLTTPNRRHFSLGTAPDATNCILHPDEPLSHRPLPGGLRAKTLPFPSHSP